MFLQFQGHIDSLCSSNTSPEQIRLQEQPDDGKVMRNRTSKRQSVDDVGLHGCRPFMASFGRLSASGDILEGSRQRREKVELGRQVGGLPTDDFT